MFSTQGLFSEIICPYQDTCVLPQCIFKHPGLQEIHGQNLPSGQDEVSLDHGQEGQRKRLKISEGNGNTDTFASDLSSQKLDSVDSKKGASPPNPPDINLKLDEKPQKKSFAATRAISPPPLRRKTQSGPLTLAKQRQSSHHGASNGKTVTAAPKPAVKKQAKPPLKQEGLNPRALKVSAPATHDFRFKLLRALHDQFVRLNTELSKDAKDDEEELVLTEQELITKALDIEQDATFEPAIYSNVVKNKILGFKRMTMKQWVEERRKEVAKEKALQATPFVSTPTANSMETPKVVETGLPLNQELTLLHRLYSPFSELSKYGYVTAIPTEKEIQFAKQGVEASGNWEVCDRCKSRFQIFPGRREEDGALASGGKCKYHFGKPYFPDRDPNDPKAKREKKYRCCGESLGESTGCVEAENHVFKITEVKRLAAVLNFEKTPENLERISDKPVCIDGEMGYTVYGLELIRLTATSWPSGEELFDVLVRPVGLILDLNSRYSGVWPQHMVQAQPHSASIPEEKDPAKRKLRIVESPAAARALLFSHISPVTPLIGHGLENDLNALRMIHPTIIDTALLFPHKYGLPYRNGLKMLMSVHLGRQIQVVLDGKMDGHDSKEDANAAGELVRYALANEWKKMKRDGWVVKDEEFRPPVPKEPPGAPREQPIQILTNAGAGRKRSRVEFQADAEDGEVMDGGE